MRNKGTSVEATSNLTEKGVVNSWKTQITFRKNYCFQINAKRNGKYLPTNKRESVSIE